MIISIFVVRMLGCGSDLNVCLSVCLKRDFVEILDQSCCYFITVGFLESNLLNFWKMHVANAYTAWDYFATAYTGECVLRPVYNLMCYHCDAHFKSIYYG